MDANLENATAAVPEKVENYSALAATKIKKELESFKGGTREKTISEYVAATLGKFCEANERFAEVVFKTPRTLSDCCVEILSGCGTHFSDISAYRAAVKFYFPNSDVMFHMQIRITGDAPSEEEINRPAKTTPTPTVRAERNIASAASGGAKPSNNTDTIHLSLF